MWEAPFWHCSIYEDQTTLGWPKREQGREGGGSKHALFIQMFTQCIDVHMHIGAATKQPIHELCFLFGSVSKLVPANACTLCTQDAVCSYWRPLLKCLHSGRLVISSSAAQVYNRWQVKMRCDLSFRRVPGTGKPMSCVHLVSNVGGLVSSLMFT